MCSSRCGSYQSSLAAVFPPDWCNWITRAPTPYAAATKSRFPGPQDGVLMVSPLITSCGCDHNSSPVAGRNPKTDFAPTAATCSSPSTLISSGEEYELVNSSDFHTTAPSACRNAMAASPWPPDRKMSVSL